MEYNIQGKLIVKEDTVQVSDKFKKREFVIEKEENNGGQVWIDTIKFQSVQAKCELLDSLNIGDIIDITFNIKGNRWEKNGKVSYFNNLDAWKVQKSDSATPSNFNPTPENGEDESPDLPF